MKTKLEGSPPEMVSACDILQQMLEHPALKEKQRVSGAYGVSTGGEAIITSSSTIETFDRNTNELTRAKYACERGMVVSPLSGEKSGRFFTTPEEFQRELEKAKRLEKEEAEWAKKGLFARLIGK